MAAAGKTQGEGSPALAFVFAGGLAGLFVLPSTRLLDLKAVAGLLAAAVLAFGLAVHLARGRLASRPAPWLFPAAVAVAAAFALAWAASPFRGLAGGRALTLATGLGLALGLALAPKDWLPPVLAAWRLGLLAVAAYALGQRFGLEPVDAFRLAGSRERAMASFGNAGALAAFLVLGWPLLLAFHGRARAAALALVFAALAATQSRAGLLALALQAAVLGALAWREGLRPRAVHLGAAVAAGLILAWAMPPGAWTRPTLRLELWSASFRLWRAHPWLGWGPGSFVLAAQDHLGAALQASLARTGQVAEDPHSLWLLLLDEGGWPALLVFAGLSAAALRAAWPQGGALGRRLALGVLGLLAASSVDRFFFLPGVFLPACLALGLAARREDAETLNAPLAALPLVLLAFLAARAAWAPLRSWRTAVGVGAGDGLNAEGDPAALRHVAEASQDAGDWDRAGLAAAAAAEAFRRALALQAASGRARNLGNALFLLGDLTGAEAAFRRSVALDPASADAHFSLGYALFQQGRMKEAVVELDAALARDPSHGGARKLKEQLLR